MTFYVVHMHISYVAISVCKIRVMTREVVDLDMKLPSNLREVFKYENKYNTCFCERIALEALS